MSTLNTLDEAGDVAIAALRAGQDFTVSVVETVGRTAARLVPEVPIPDLGLPRPKEVAASAFRFWEKLAEAQKEFTLRVLEALDPTAPKKTAPKKAA